MSVTSSYRYIDREIYHHSIYHTEVTDTLKSPSLINRYLKLFYALVHI